MATATISILIPFKNTEAYLEECLASILDQTYQDWEVLAVDDHSTDTSKAIASDFSSMDGRIIVLKNNGEGIISALRTAYGHSKGQYITRMDSDDIMTSNKLEQLAAGLSKHGEGHLAIGQVNYFSEEGIGDGYLRYEQWLNDLTAASSNYDEIYKECVIPSPCWMAFRTDLDFCGAFKDNRYPEDYDLAFRFYEAGLKCIPCNQVLHHWRDYGNRTSRTNEHYAQNYFLDLKVHYFLKLDREPDRPLVVWGAGAKGKAIAKFLAHKNLSFSWVCDNPKKIGNDIYGMKMLNYRDLHTMKNPQTIVTVANARAQAEIVNYLEGLGQKTMTDYYFFC